MAPQLSARLHPASPASPGAADRCLYGQSTRARAFIIQGGIRFRCHLADRELRFTAQVSYLEGGDDNDEGEGGDKDEGEEMKQEDDGPDGDNDDSGDEDESRAINVDGEDENVMMVAVLERIMVMAIMMLMKMVMMIIMVSGLWMVLMMLAVMKKKRILRMMKKMTMRSPVTMVMKMVCVCVRENVGRKYIQGHPSTQEHS